MSKRLRSFLVGTLVASATLEKVAAASQQPQTTPLSSPSSSSLRPTSSLSSAFPSLGISATQTAAVPSHSLLHPTVAPRRREFWMEWARGGAPNSLARPAAIQRRRTTTNSSNQRRQRRWRHPEKPLLNDEEAVQHVVSLKTQQFAKKLKSKLPPPPPKRETGFFYGFTVDMMDTSTTSRPVTEKKPKPPKLRDVVVLTLDEIRIMRAEMEELRRELQALKQELAPKSPMTAESSEKAKVAVGIEAPARLSKAELEKFYDDISANLEGWAKHILQEGEADGWTPVKCNKAMRKSFNPNDATVAYLKWLKDGRGEGHVDPDDDRDYPCLKCMGTIDAPLDVVCLYLAKKENLLEYNDLIDQQKDLQEITPSSKICLTKTPQILFIQPRCLVTYCKHKWLADGSQLLVLNQAVRHPKRLDKENLSVFEKSDWVDDKKQPMAFALRGANLIEADPDDPQHKTRLTILAHGNPGRDVPSWAMKTVVGALANIEPYRFFYRINQSILDKLPELQQELQQRQTQLVSSGPREDGRTSRPAGIAQLGYACFWPQGGGTVEQEAVGKATHGPSRPVGVNEADDSDAPSGSQPKPHSLPYAAAPVVNSM